MISETIIRGGDCGGGKSYDEYLKIQKYVHDGVFPSWTLDIYNVLIGFGLHFYISCNENNIYFNILNVPKDLWGKIHEKTYELGLIFRIHERERAIYSGHPLLINPRDEPRRVVGYMKSGIEFYIREPYIGEDISEIFYTVDRKY